MFIHQHLLFKMLLFLSQRNNAMAQSNHLTALYETLQVCGSDCKPPESPTHDP